MKKQLFNQGWTFQPGNAGIFQTLVGGNEDTQTVTLPHDASIRRPRNPEEPNGAGNGFFREENYTYTREFTLDPTDKDKNIYIEFEGVYQNAFVYINNAYAGKCPYGYGNFYIDATKFVTFDHNNTIKVIVKNGLPSGRWYTGGGIYRDVHIMKANRLHLAPDSVHLAVMDIDDGQAVIRSESTIEYTGTGVRGITLTIELLDDEGRIAGSDTIPVTVMEHSVEHYRQTFYVDAPKLWDVDTPYLYHYRATLKEDGEILDEENGTFGIRQLQLDAKHGLRINGRVVKLRGGCIHHDNGAIGTAEFAHAEEFRVKTLKDAGYNAIRSSHYPMSRRLLDACDKLGMLVMDEYSDVWTSTKVDFDYGTHMMDWWEHDITNLVNKDYNHPCVIMYSIGNEIPEAGNKFDVQWGKKLADLLHRLDDTRYVTNSLNLLLCVASRRDEIMADIMKEQGIDPDAAKAAGANPEINSLMSNLGAMMEMLVGSRIAGEAIAEAAGQVDITGYNYAASRYEKDCETYPNRILVGSETYPGDLDINWALVEKNPRVIGDFSWTAWDYLGEAGIGRIHYGEAMGMDFYAPYPCKAAYCGDINLIGDRRPVSYWREIVWGLRQAPYLAVQPPKYHDVKHHMTSWSMTNAVHSWNWSGFEGKPVTVEAYTDGDEAALYVNGQLVQRKAVGEKKSCITYFETVYTPGTLEVAAFKNGIETGRDRIVTAQDQVHICATVDCRTIPSDASDICYVEISMQDSAGVLNPEASTRVRAAIEGPGVILGFGSADPDSDENYFDPEAAAYEGRLRAAIRGNGQPGTITLTLSAKDCAPVNVHIEAV